MNKSYLANIVGTDLKRIRDDVRFHKGMMERHEEQKQMIEERKNKVNPDASLQLTQQKGQAVVRWVVTNKDGHMDIQPETIRPGDSVALSVYGDGQESVDLPPYLRVIGQKINLQAQVDKFKDAYMKNYVQTKSHNLIMAKFSEFKISVLGWLLSMAGVNSGELQRMQKKAVEGALRENKLLFEENEYNAELISIVGGNSKQTKSQMRVISEIRKQIIAQCDRMGLKDYYTEDRMLDIRLRQCRSIHSRFREEEMKLEYQLAYC